MGVITMAYSVPPEKMRKFKKDCELLDKLSIHGEELDPDWDFESFSFEKGWEETVDILRAGGFASFGKKLNHENFWDCDGYEVWSVTPKAVGAVAKAIKTADFETLKAIGIEKELTNYWGEKIHDYMYSYYLGDIEELKKFLEQTAEKGNFLLFATM